MGHQRITFFSLYNHEENKLHVAYCLMGLSSCWKNNRSSSLLLSRRKMNTEMENSESKRKRKAVEERS